MLVAAVRSGGTFLAHCLSNHSQIFCDRGEPLHHGNVWREAGAGWRRRLLAILLNQTGYRVSMCKLTYTQALHREIWPWLVERQPLVIWLRRENVVRQAVSALINRQARGGRVKRPQHSFTEVKRIRVELDPEAILKQARGLAARDKRAGRMLGGRMKRLCRLTYAEVVGGEMCEATRLPLETTKGVCGFLGVDYELLRCELKRVNPGPLREMLTLKAWRAVEKAIRKSEFEELLGDG